MEPVLHENDILLIKKQISSHSLSHGDIIIFESPLMKNFIMIKRIVAIPGDSIKITNKNDLLLNTGNGISNVLENSDFWVQFDWILKPAEYIVLGDNRIKSQDSRTFGPITFDKIQGKAILKIKPLSRIK